MSKDKGKHFAPLEIVVDFVGVFSVGIHIAVFVHIRCAYLYVAVLEDMVTSTHDCDQPAETEAECHAAHAYPCTRHHAVEHYA